MSSQSPAAMALQILLGQERETSRLLRAVNIKYEERISLLEKVAEAAITLLPIYIRTPRERKAERALRAAGYLGEGE